MRQTFLRSSTIIGATAWLLSSCASVPSNVPVRGDRETLAQLVGKWEGVYNSESTGRSGVISFTLRAGADTAQGEVIMIPRSDRDNMNVAAEDAIRKQAQPASLLTIRFVAAARDEVRGVLDPYPDPNCGCTLTTRFLGRLDGDEIKGTFESAGSEIFHEKTRGTWSVRKSALAEIRKQ